MLQQADIFRSIEPTIAMLFGLGYSKEKQIFSQIAKVSDVDKAIEDATEYGGMTIFEEKGEGEPFKEDEIRQGWSTRWIAKAYGSLMTVSREANDDSRLPEVKSASKAFGTAARLTPEYQFALFLDRGFTSTYKVVGDRLSLFNAAHTTPRGGTYSNLLSDPIELSEEGIEQVMIACEGMQGTDDLLHPIMAKKLVVPRQLGPTAKKLMLTKKTVGSNFNDVSIVAGELDTVVYPFLGSAVRWMVTTDVTEEGDGLFYKYRQRPEFGRDNVTKIQAAYFYCWFRAYWGVRDARGVFGSGVVG